MLTGAPYVLDVPAAPRLHRADSDSVKGRRFPEALLGRRRDRLARRFTEVGSAFDGQPGFVEEAEAFLKVRAVKAGDDRYADIHGLVRVDDALRDHIDAGHAPEDVDEDGFDG